MPSRTWYILAAIWIAGALAWFSWVDYTAAHDAAASACSAAKDTATCLTLAQTGSSAAMWNRSFTHDCLWALLPALALLLLGGIAARLWRPRRARDG